MKCLYEILVPTIYGDTLKPIKTRSHRHWDSWVQKITGGLTILSPGKGKWIYKGVEYPEKVIPVRIMCDEKDLDKITSFTLRFYRQKALMFYRISDDVRIIYARD